MIQSMTGYGSATLENENISVTIEIKSLNSKFLDIFCRIPRSYSDREIEIRNVLTQKLERGKVEFIMTITPKMGDSAPTKINRQLMKAYLQDLKISADSANLKVSDEELFKQVLLLPNIFSSDLQDETTNENETLLIFQTLNEAIKKLTKFRMQEGKNTSIKFEEYIANISSNLKNIEEFDPNRIQNVRERIEKAILEVVSKENFDRNRYEQELIYYIEKFDISEEKVRLSNHLKYFLEELKLASNGKKLNFIAQEIGREVNTIGSKANDVNLQKFVVQMKDELEKIKEQTLNII